MNKRQEANTIMRRAAGLYDWQGVHDVTGPKGLRALANKALAEAAAQGEIPAGYRIFEMPLTDSLSTYYIGNSGN